MPLKLFVLFFISIQFLFSLEIEDIDLKTQIIKKNKEIVKFKENTNYDNLQDFTLKLFFDKEKLKDKRYYLILNSKAQNIKSINTSYLTELDNILLVLSKETKSPIIIKIKNNPSLKIKYNFTLISQFEFKYFYRHIKLIAGLSYGIIFCAFLYSLIIYVNTYHRSILYYGLMQFFLLFSFIQGQWFQLFKLAPLQVLINDTAINLTIIMTILFSKEVLIFKKYKYLVQKVFSFLLLINIIDILYILVFNGTFLYALIPLYSIILFVILLGILAFIQGQKFAIFYLAGWGVIFLCLLIVKYEILDLDEKIIFNIGIPIESLILSISLGYRLKNILKEKKEKEDLLIQKSKAALMGEMLNNIAHQWRQPLNNLSFINMDLQIASQKKQLSEKYVKEIVQDSKEQIRFMSQTLDNFKGFYQPNKAKENFLLSHAVKQAIDIVKPSLSKNQITINLDILNDAQVQTYANEYSQVVLNILSNAKDALIQREIKNAHIQLQLFTKNKKHYLQIHDNAQGIKKDILEKIFTPYFSTKAQNSGIGLYMSKIIMESHLNGKIEVENKQKGACFTIII